MKPIAFAAALLLAAAAALADSSSIPPPVYDVCDRAIPAGAENFESYTGDTCDGANDVVDHDCDTWTQTYAPEDVYEITLGFGCWFTANVVHTGDAMLMVAAECRVEGTMFTCLASADAAGPGELESLHFANETEPELTVWLVVDTELEADCGAYTLDLISDCPVAAASATWGALKRAYR